MTRMIRRTQPDARYVRKTIKLQLSPEERTFLEAAVLIGHAAGNSVIGLKDVACPNCDAIARKLSKRGLIIPWKNEGEGTQFTIAEEAKREVLK